MPDPSNNNSFIPKRGPAQKSRGTGARKIYAFGVFSYILVFATLVGSAGVFLYDRLIQNNLDTAVQNLDQEIQNFSEEDMQEVSEFESRLNQANTVLNNSVSLLPVFSSLEMATINTVWLKSLDMERENGSMNFSLSVETDSFDSTIFQRGRLVNNDVIGNVEISNLNRGFGSDSDDEEGSVPPGTVVSFTADLSVPMSAVPFTVSQDSMEDIMIISAPPVDEDTGSPTTTDTNDLEDNQDNI